MGSFHFGYALLALVISSVLWAFSHGSSKIERSYDIPVVFHGVPEELVIVEQSTAVVNIRALGPRAAHRDISPTKMEYGLSLEGAKPGPAVFEVNETRLELPSGARILSRSPNRIDVEFESRSRKSVRINADVSGKPAPGFVMAGVEILPPRVWLAGARSDVLRLREVGTETVDVDGAIESLEREVRLSLGGGHVWVDQDEPIRVRVQIDAVAADAIVAEENE
ncbi:MAG: CdaR family protein [Myxococcota bacterium]